MNSVPFKVLENPGHFISLFFYTLHFLNVVSELRGELC